MHIVIIDDDQLVAISLKTILESTPDIEVDAIGSSGLEAIELYKTHKPDVLLMDIRMQEMSGLEAGEKILSDFPNANILYLTTFADDEYIVKALHIGAKGYLLKQDFESIAPAIKAVHTGQTVFGHEIIHKIPSMISDKKNSNYTDFGITEKEYELLELIAEGMNNKEIAAELFLSEGTVRNYLSNLLEKLELRDRTQLAVFYYKNF